MKPLFDVHHLAYLFHHLTCEVCALVRFNLDWCSPELEDLVRYYSCHCVCTVIAGGNRFDPFGKFVNCHKAIMIPPFGTR